MAVNYGGALDYRAQGKNPVEQFQIQPQGRPAGGEQDPALSGADPTGTEANAASAQANVEQEQGQAGGTLKSVLSQIFNQPKEKPPVQGDAGYSKGNFSKPGFGGADYT